MVSISQLAAAYSRMGFVQKSNDPFTFERDDGLMLFHHPFDGEVELTFILEDIAVWDPGLADRLRDIISTTE